VRVGGVLVWVIGTCGWYARVVVGGKGERRKCRMMTGGARAGGPGHYMNAFTILSPNRHHIVTE